MDLTFNRTSTRLTHLGMLSLNQYVPYISFDAIIGRNSVFHELTNEQLEELGGVEYRALNALMWLVPLVRLVFCSCYGRC